MKENKRIAILGGGPSGLFMYKRLVDANRNDLIIDIFEKKKQLGAGMPYSTEGASDEHITNVSGNEIPELVTSISDWIAGVPKETLDYFHIDPKNFNDYKVLPRLLFGQYLTAQFKLLEHQARKIGMETTIHFESEIVDIIDHPEKGTVSIEVKYIGLSEYDQVIICTGHHWLQRYEGNIPGYFDSPYPPAKLATPLNHSIAIKGSSLTAIDAIRTLSRYNGTYTKDQQGRLVYHLGAGQEKFKMVMHSRNGMLPAVRFHLEDPHLLKDAVLSKTEATEHRESNAGFLSLDYVFRKNFKDLFISRDPEFYERIKDMDMESFVEMVMELRERLDPFTLFRAEYLEAEQSIKRHESVFWKELLAVLSFAMNYPAKYFSAEDMQRLQKVLMPLISIVIAFVPQSSVEEMLALHEAGVLDMVAVGHDSEVEPCDEGGVIYHYNDDKGKSPYFKTYVDCVGQPHLAYEDLPYQSLRMNQTVSPARLRFQDPQSAVRALEKGEQHIEQEGNGDYYLRVPGITINDDFQVVDPYGALNERIYMMAVPYLGGYNPDYSGLDFCEAASAAIINSILEHEQIDSITHKP